MGKGKWRIADGRWLIALVFVGLAMAGGAVARDLLAYERAAADILHATHPFSGGSVTINAIARGLHEKFGLNVLVDRTGALPGLDKVATLPSTQERMQDYLLRACRKLGYNFDIEPETIVLVFRPMPDLEALCYRVPIEGESWVNEKPFADSAQAAQAVETLVKEVSAVPEGKAVLLEQLSAAGQEALIRLVRAKALQQAQPPFQRAVQSLDFSQGTVRFQTAVVDGKAVKYMAVDWQGAGLNVEERMLCAGEPFQEVLKRRHLIE